jgi:hypothetical protein
MPMQMTLAGPWSTEVQENRAPDGTTFFTLVFTDAMTQDVLVVPFDRSGLQQHARAVEEKLTGIAQPPVKRIELPR